MEAEINCCVENSIRYRFYYRDRCLTMAVPDASQLFEKYSPTIVKLCTLGSIFILFGVLISFLNHAKHSTNQVVASVEEHLEKAQHKDGLLLNATIRLLAKTLDQLDQENGEW